MDNFSWTKVYNKIAYKMLEYKDKPKEFAELMYKILEEARLINSEEKGSNLDSDGEKRFRYTEIDPISFMNRFDMYKESKRKKLIEEFQKNTNMKKDIPNDFNGIPATNPHKSMVIVFKDGRKKEDVPNIWKLFESALTLNINKEADRKKFIEYYDKVVSRPCAKFNISIGLFKIRPDIFINLDATNRDYIEKMFNIKIRSCPSGEEYLEILSTLKSKLKSQNETFLDFSYSAWINKHRTEKNYWIYAPGENAKMWEDCLENKVMSLGFDKIGDLNQFKNSEELFLKLKEVYGKENPKNDKCALDDFKNEIKIGDIIIVKKGVYKLLGYGEVTSDYYYDKSRDNYKKVRNVNWIKTGEWNVADVEGTKQVALKTLTKITQYGDYYKKLLNLMEEKGEAVKMKNKENRNYFWLNANPRIWSFSELKNGGIIEYTAVNEYGNKRRIYRNYENAKKGDIVIAYEASPTKAIVGICEVVEELKNNILKIRKIETLVNPIYYKDIIENKELSEMECIKNSQGSLFRLEENEYNVIMDMIMENNFIEKKAKEKYTKVDFLKDVYISENQYEELKNVLLRKKNVILQGAPGVGKTYMAKRLAYSINGEKDSEKVTCIQFHQSYSYEDFIEGYRPVEGGFELEKGIFYNFCKKAENDPDNKYFFIIDEINRGNLSKIFGELLMLIENDKRNEKAVLTYSKINFSVPENVYVIGMMNTADRSLSIMDYALRRRFSFYDVEPAFNNEKFKKYQDNLKSNFLNQIIMKIQELNDEIEKDSSLGKGFKIGHSYFCDLKGDIDGSINSILKYEILPMLEEYWFDDYEKFNNWKKLLMGE